MRYAALRAVRFFWEYRRDLVSPEQCVEAAFRFLLDREPKESILRSFDVAVISRYFLEFDQELSRYLSRS